MFKFELKEADFNFAVTLKLTKASPYFTATRCLLLAAFNFAFLTLGIAELFILGYILGTDDQLMLK